MKALEDCVGEDAENFDYHMKIEDKMSKLNRERAQTTEYPAKDFVTGSKVQKLIEAGMRKSTSHCRILC